MFDANRAAGQNDRLSKGSRLSQPKRVLTLFWQIYCNELTQPKNIWSRVGKRTTSMLIRGTAT